MQSGDFQTKQTRKRNQADEKSHCLAHRVSAYASNLAWAAKKGEPVTIAVSFTLADPGDALAKTPPHSVYVPQALDGYLNP